MRSLANPKRKVKVGCWNLRTLFSIEKSAQLVAEARNYGVEILGVRECRWCGFEKVRTQTGEFIIQSGRNDDVHLSPALFPTWGEGTDEP